MKIQTMSIVCGTTECNAHCPFCISKTTPKMGTDLTYAPSGGMMSADFLANSLSEKSSRNLMIASRLAAKGGATTCLVTGKGEPTLYPDLISRYLSVIAPYFPLIEMQTNGIAIGQDDELNSSLTHWYSLGLTTIALSAVETGFANKKIYGDNYPELSDTIKKIHSFGLSVRLSIMMLKKYIDSPKQVERLVAFCKENKVEQLTIRPIVSPDNVDSPTTRGISDHTLTDKQVEDIKTYIKEKATPVLHLAHGATVYDLDGQNLCYATCLTTNKTTDNMRQIIHFPDGTIGYDWKYEGAILL